MLTLFYFLATILLASNVCGIIDRIAGGALAQKELFPFFAEIFIGYYRTLDDYMPAGCGGSLIQPRWILTAAHCFRKEVSIPYEMFTLNKIIAHMGSEKTDPFDPNDIFVRFVNNAYIHNDYVYKRIAETEYLECDIALAELKKPFTLSSYIGTIRLPDKTTPLCGSGVIIGRGIARFAEQNNVPVEYAYVTAKSSEMVSRPPEYTRVNIFYSEMYWYNGHPLQGDPGGPFICYENFIPVLIGVISSYYNNTLIGTTISEYEYVERYLDFIYQYVEFNTALVPQRKLRRTNEPQHVSRAVTLIPVYLISWMFILFFVLLGFLTK